MDKIEKIFNLKNKVAVITGGAGYLCSQMAITLNNIGVKIIILDKNLKQANNIINKINKKNKENSSAYFLDVKSKQSFEVCIKKIQKNE